MSFTICPHCGNQFNPDNDMSHADICESFTKMENELKARIEATAQGQEVAVKKLDQILEELALLQLKG